MFSDFINKLLILLAIVIVVLCFNNVIVENMSSESYNYKYCIKIFPFYRNLNYNISTNTFSIGECTSFYANRPIGNTDIVPLIIFNSNNNTYQGIHMNNNVLTTYDLNSPAPRTSLYLQMSQIFYFEPASDTNSIGLTNFMINVNGIIQWNEQIPALLFSPISEN